MRSREVTISCYENEVPAFVEAELEQLYGSLQSSLAHFRIYGGIEHASTYVVRRGGKAIAVFLFRREKSKVQVINEVIRIEAEEIFRFVNYIYTAFGSVTVVVFHAVQIGMQRLPFPSQRFLCTEDIVLELPASVEAYVASLGHATRKNIKRHKNKLQRSFPSFCYRAYAKEEVDEQHILDIIDLNRARMAEKNKISAIDEIEAERIIRLVKECGLVGVATIDGKVCAGTIAYRLGQNHVFSRVNAHDSQYDNYGLGIICCYLTICECIDRDAKQFHFMWGHYEYKTALMGLPQSFDHFVVYRSLTHVLLNADMALKTVFRGYVLQTKLWLLYKAAGRGKSAISRLASRFLNDLRRLKRLKASLLGLF